MDIQDALFAVGLLIVVAKLLEGVFKRFGLNSIIAYATTGVILGPVTGLVETGSEVEVILASAFSSSSSSSAWRNLTSGASWQPFVAG